MVSASPGTQPNSTPSGTRRRHWTSEVQVLVGPPQRNTGRCTSSGRAATASQWLGLHLTRPNTAPRMSLVRVSGVPTATSNDPEGGSQRRERTAGPSPNPSGSRTADNDVPIASPGLTLTIKPQPTTPPRGKAPRTNEPAQSGRMEVEPA